MSNPVRIPMYNHPDLVADVEADVYVGHGTAEGDLVLHVRGEALNGLGGRQGDLRFVLTPLLDRIRESVRRIGQ